MKRASSAELFSSELWGRSCAALHSLRGLVEPAEPCANVRTALLGGFLVRQVSDSRQRDMFLLREVLLQRRGRTLRHNAIVIAPEDQRRRLAERRARLRALGVDAAPDPDEAVGLELVADRRRVGVSRVHAGGPR